MTGKATPAVDMIQWGRIVMKRFGNRGRVMRVAWKIDKLAAKRGYAWALDDALERETNLAKNHVQEVLLRLERAGLIRREWVNDGGKEQRRIYPVLPADDSVSGETSRRREVVAAPKVSNSRRRFGT